MVERILCIGAGYVGGPTMAVIAKHCPNVQVVVADINPERVAAWQSARPPIIEPGLEEVVRTSLGRNLRFTADVDQAIGEAEMIFVSVNTPTKTFGQGMGRAADLQYWEKTARSILRNARRPVIVVEKSTLPVRTAEAMERIFKNRREDQHFEVLSNPEFLAEGTAIADLESPDRVLIGGAEKANTGDMRESPAIQICQELLAEQAHVCITDPQALEGARQIFGDSSDRVTFEPDAYKAAEGAHAVALLTDWAEYRVLDYRRVYAAMERPAFLFDGRNLLDPRGAPSNRVQCLPDRPPRSDQPLGSSLYRGPEAPRAASTWLSQTRSRGVGRRARRRRSSRTASS